MNKVQIKTFLVATPKDLEKEFNSFFSGLGDFVLIKTDLVIISDNQLLYTILYNIKN